MQNDSRRFWLLNALVWAVYAGLGALSTVGALGWSSGAVLIAVTVGVLLFLASGGLRGLALHRDWLRHDARRLALRMLASSVAGAILVQVRSEEHTSELQSREKLVCRLLLVKKNGLVKSSYYTD